MSDVVRFAVFGLATGSLYGLLGLGLVVVHRSSGVVNFSHAGIAMVAGYIYYDAQSHGYPKPAAMLLGLFSGAVLGLLIYLLVIRPLGQASGLTKGIATLAVLVILQSGSTLRYGDAPQSAPSFLPTDKVRLLGATITADNLIIFGLGVVLVAALTAVYRRTRFGMATTAVSENEFAFATLGHSATRVATANWVIGGTLAAVAGVLIAPLVAITPTQSTSLLLPALAVALAGRFSSFPVTLGAALLVGVGQAELTRYSTTGFLSKLSGLPSALPFLVIIVILSLRGRSLPTRDFVSATLPRVSSAVISRFWITVWAGLAIILIYSVSTDWVTAVTTGLISAMLLLSLVVVTGYAGQLSLAQVSISGVGILTASKLVSAYGWPMPAAAVAGIGATLLGAFVIGLPALRTRGVTLAVVTLGLADALNSMLFNRNDVNAEGLGMTVGEAKFFGLHIDELLHPRRYALFALILLTAVAFAVANLRRSRIGKVLVAVRANERASAGLGISVATAKLYAFVVAGGIAGVAGLLAAWRLPNVLFAGNFDAFRSVNAVVAATLGGIGYISGGIVGGAVTEPGGIGGKIVTGLGFGEWLALITGGLLLVNILFNPDGMVPNTIDAIKRLTRAVNARIPHRRGPAWLGLIFGTRRGGAAELQRAGGNRTPTPVGDVLLDVRDLRVKFGATIAVNGVSLQCRGGEVVGIIGPNGSGKTTFIDAITGYVKAEGSVELNGRPLHTLPTHRRNRSGISRSFQSLELFEELDVADNLLVASDRGRWWAWLTCFAVPGRTRPNAAVLAAVDEFDLLEVLDRHPNELPYGKRRLLAIARALATGPQVLLLDEPAAGLGDTDRTELRRLVRRLADDWGMAVVLIEHDVALVMDVSDRVMAMEFGSKIAEGPPSEVRRHPEVVRAYLGSDDEATASSSRRHPLPAAATVSSTVSSTVLTQRGEA
jgi:ABC-type branched-subunit amino acid transport system ATPase component/ABC-type branched-subunit amino acid transport system permease subunit